MEYFGPPNFKAMCALLKILIQKSLIPFEITKI